MKAIVKVQAVQLIPNQSPTPPGFPTTISSLSEDEDTVMVQLMGDVNLNFRTGTSSAPMVGDTFEIQLTKLVKLGEQVNL